MSDYFQSIQELNTADFELINNYLYVFFGLKINM